MNETNGTSEARTRSVVAIALGVFMLISGLAAFVVPLQHAGPYGIPGRGLVGGLLCFASAAVLLARGAPKWSRVAVGVASPVVLFFALYGALAEVEEVVVLYAGDAELRLWIVDDEGVEWVRMPRAKAERHALDGARLELLRAGETRCVIPRVVDDAAANRRMLKLREKKYAIHRFGKLLGMFGDEPSPESAVLRFDPCE